MLPQSSLYVYIIYLQFFASQFEFSGDIIRTSFTILGPAPIKGDSQNTVEQVSLQEATDRLTEAFTTNKLIIYVMTDPTLVWLDTFVV